MSDIDDVDNEDKLVVPDALPLVDLLPRGYLSVSQVTQYMKCGKAYEYRYIQEIQIPRNSYMVQGTAVHSAAEKLHLGMMGVDAHDDPPLEYVESVYSDTLDQQLTSDVVIAEEDVDAGHIKDVGIDLTRHYYLGSTGKLADPDTKVPYPRLKPTAVEKVIRTTIHPTDGSPIPFLAIIDLIDDGKVIADLKTKKKKSPESEAVNSLQLSLYAGIENIPDVRRDMLVKPGKKTPQRYFRTPHTRTAGEIAHATDIASDVAENIVLGRFPRTMPDNWWCTKDWCAYWGHCRGKKR